MPTFKDNYDVYILNQLRRNIILKLIILIEIQKLHAKLIWESISLLRTLKATCNKTTTLAICSIYSKQNKDVVTSTITQYKLNKYKDERNSSKNLRRVYRNQSK